MHSQLLSLNKFKFSQVYSWCLNLIFIWWTYYYILFYTFNYSLLKFNSVEPTGILRSSPTFLSPSQTTLPAAASSLRISFPFPVLDFTSAMAPTVTLDTINPKVFISTLSIFLFIFSNVFDYWDLSIGVSASVFGLWLFFVSLSPSNL